jgi:hypothetical protein
LVIASFATPFLLQISSLTKLNGSVFFINRLFVWGVLILLWYYIKSFGNQKLLIWTESKRKGTFYILSTIIILIVLFIGNLFIVHVLTLFKLNETSHKFLEYIDILKAIFPCWYLRR